MYFIDSLFFTLLEQMFVRNLYIQISEGKKDIDLAYQICVKTLVLDVNE